jgi:hypothetical protein
MVPTIVIVNVPASSLEFVYHWTTLVFESKVINVVDVPGVLGVTVMEYTMSAAVHEIEFSVKGDIILEDEEVPTV